MFSPLQTVAPNGLFGWISVQWEKLLVQQFCSPLPLRIWQGKMAGIYMHECMYKYLILKFNVYYHIGIFMIITYSGICNSPGHKIQDWLQVQNTSLFLFIIILFIIIIIYVCLMIWLAFVAKLMQNGSCIFPETPAQFPPCHVDEGNAKKRTKKSSVSTGYVIRDDCVCVVYKHVLLKGEY